MIMWKWVTQKKIHVGEIMGNTLSENVQELFHTGHDLHATEDPHFNNSICLAFRTISVIKNPNME